MKKSALLISMVIFISNPLFSYEKTIKDNSGRTTSYLKKTGDRVYEVDRSGNRGNYTTSDGTIKDRSGNTIGYMKQNGKRLYYTDRSGRLGDYIEPDGTIKDKYGRRKGTIK